MTTMTMNKRTKMAALLLPLMSAAAISGVAYSDDGHRHAGDIPRYVVDPYWPKPLPNRWVTGAVGGICIDHQDHVFGINRSDITALELRVGKVAAPPVIEYDGEGNVVAAWGDPNVLPLAIHGCFVDHERNLWIAGSGGGMVQKWSRDGKKLLLQIGSRTTCDGPCGETQSLNSSRTTLNQPADLAVDPVNGDVYIADGYGNHRVVVFNSQGVYLRQWGSSGSGPSQFSPIGGGHPHCVVLSKEGLVYVCDRGNDRIQVFDKAGNLVSIIPLKPGTGYVPAPDGTPGRQGVGSALDVAFTPDKHQEYLLNVDTGNEVLWILDHDVRRGEIPQIVGGFGSQGHGAGNFTLLHMIATDSKGNLYTSETVDGRRLQKFVRKGHVSPKQTDTYMGSPHYQPFPNGE
jgi:DNA-binding beta-propeller fold protein YncE